MKFILCILLIITNLTALAEMNFKSSSKSLIIYNHTQILGNITRIVTTEAPPPGGSYKTIGSQTEPTKEKEEVTGITAIYPNPFDNQTIIEFRLNEEVDVKLQILDIEGREIKLLYQGKLKKGKNIATFYGDGLVNGNYICILSIEGNIVSREQMILKR
ncbi:MAG: T9SS type A sorting domain-containing protein [Candidatus Kapabacteria bacterium]|nr:T9SS type A sorting domain-containing protein [Candidatus Kapabacteria bacterium]